MYGLKLVKILEHYNYKKLEELINEVVNDYTMSELKIKYYTNVIKNENNEDVIYYTAFIEVYT